MYLKTKDYTRSNLTTGVRCLGSIPLSHRHLTKKILLEVVRWVILWRVLRVLCGRIIPLPFFLPRRKCLVLLGNVDCFWRAVDLSGQASENILY